MTSQVASRLAIIGCGAVFEAFYLDATIKLAKAGQLKVALLVDTDQAQAAKHAPQFPGAQVADSLGDFLKSMSINRALVLTPPSTHATILTQLAASNVHAYCEKPLTVQPEEARRIDALFRKSGLVCNVGFVRRMFPNMRLFKSQFARLEEPRRLTISDGEVFRWPIKTAGIFRPDEPGGGVVWDKLSHNLDIVQWIDGLESVARVESDCRPGRVPADIRVEGRTRHGTYRVAVSWTEVLPNLVRGYGGGSLIESKNGLTDSVFTSGLDGAAVSFPLDVATYPDAVAASLLAFLQSHSSDAKSRLATAEESVALTSFLAEIDRQARKQP